MLIKLLDTDIFREGGYVRSDILFMEESEDTAFIKFNILYELYNCNVLEIKIKDKKMENAIKNLIDQEYIKKL